ncbi:hypothetical protein [Streptomyces bohaiensis]|uniref:Uncharacterized protein n=1 Tax=Streptomyces bohaiensis TaxID=1431344 RepID=A0ABX1CCM3_9ACTN|nr:hypothetical protein [Streptomyces bohaiensis]NJQ16860.1 hypothetical protein [Streptomyces bohaiensis]
MSRPAGGAAVLAAHCSHTHLFPGARVLVAGVEDPEAFAADPHPLTLALSFTDGVVTEAEFVLDDDAGALLAVPAHTTDAGTDIPDHRWLVPGAAAAGGDVRLTIGRHAPA